MTENIFLIIIAKKSVYIFGVMQWQIKNSYCSPLDVVEIDDEGNVKVNGKVINEQISKKKAVNKNKHRIAMFISMLAILIVIGVSWRLKKILEPTQIEDLINKQNTDDWDLTLFTCTSSGAARCVIRCKAE